MTFRGETAKNYVQGVVQQAGRGTEAGDPAPGHAEQVEQ